WGEADLALPQFLAEGDLDFIVFDYLAEITMSIMARAKAADPEKGYAIDFVSAIVAPHLHAIANSGVTLISNAGGVNPEACGRAIRQLIEDAGLSLKVAVITGDDLMPKLGQVLGSEPTEMFTGEPTPPREAIASANAYLGAFPIAEALNQGADIVVTGRCVDSAVTLGACIHRFGWQHDDLDLLAAGSLAGHLIECGPQVTGGNYTDWHEVADTLHEVGYPIAEIAADGAVVMTKPKGTGGCVTKGTVGEQLLYEIGDPAAYYLPDVICDFTQVGLEQIDTDRVAVTGARGRGVPGHYKTSLTWADGWRAGMIGFYVGARAAEKARIFADEAIQRARRKLSEMGASDYVDVCVEVVGDESHWGEAARYVRSREVAVKVACRHADRRATDLLMRELSGVGLGAPAGFCSFAGTRPKSSPVIRLFSILVDRDLADIQIHTGDQTQSFTDGVPVGVGVANLAEAVTGDDNTAVSDEAGAVATEEGSEQIEVPLERLAWARSGDKGDKANIGVMARKREYFPWIAAALTQPYVASRFEHFMASSEIDRYVLPGLPALNFVLHRALGGGGVASLRNDPQAKGYAQILLDTPVTIPAQLLED
ncbi:MAG: acyclic terpene utilization AtuA family protein, partial [Halieaceae bacterium]